MGWLAERFSTSWRRADRHLVRPGQAFMLLGLVGLAASVAALEPSDGSIVFRVGLSMTSVLYMASSGALLAFIANKGGAPVPLRSRIGNVGLLFSCARISIASLLPLAVGAAILAVGPYNFFATLGLITMLVGLSAHILAVCAGGALALTQRSNNRSSHLKGVRSEQPDGR